MITSVLFSRLNRDVLCRTTPNTERFCLQYFVRLDHHNG